MKTLVFTAILGMIAYSSFSQSNSFYKVGDTLYYANNRATFIKTNTLVIIKETNVAQNSNSFMLEKHLMDTKAKKYVLDSKFVSNGLQELRSNGAYISYHKNGEQASKGETVNGRKGSGLWTYWYENGKKRSEEELSTETFFNNQRVSLVMNFWDEKGVQTVENGNGFAQFISTEDGLFYKGSYKGGLKNSLWTAFNGKIKIFDETYKNGKLIKGTSWDEQGEAFNYKKIFTPAYYKKQSIGIVEKYVGRKFNSNTIGVSGNILVNFKVTKEGNVNNINITKGLNQEYNSEVVRILSEMSGWVPAKKRGQSLDSVYSLNLNFKD